MALYYSTFPYLFLLYAFIVLLQFTFTNNYEYIIYLGYSYIMKINDVVIIAKLSKIKRNCNYEHIIIFKAL